MVISMELLEAAEKCEKTIVLVEGTSDKDILEFAIKQLYPHLPKIDIYEPINKEEVLLL